MKTLIMAGCLFLGAGALNTAKAQITLSINIGAQPSWGPTGYDHVEYYYLPDIQCYYYVPSHQFIYLGASGHWMFSNDLPPRYRGYDLYHSYKVVMNEPQPYLHYADHRRQYAGYRGDAHGQEFIRNSHDDRYRDHWHDQQEADEEWRHDGHHDNGHHYGQDKHGNG